MPFAFLLALVLLGLLILFTWGIVRTVLSRRKRGIYDIIIFLISTLVMIFSFVEFADISIFVSDTNTPVTSIHGEGFGLALPFINLLLVTALWVLMGSRLLTKNKFIGENN
jgi:hypothetical protein